MGVNEASAFTEGRYRRSSGNKKMFQSRRKNSVQRTKPSFRRTSASSGASTGTVNNRQGGQIQKNRRSSTASSSTSDGSSDATEELDDPGIDPPGIDLGEDGLGTGLVLEMLILEALVNHPELPLFKTNGSLSQLKFAHPEGDLFTFLNVTRQWVVHLQRGTVDSWYEENEIQESTLRHVEAHVEARRKSLVQKTGQRIPLAFGKDTFVSDQLISNVILSKFNDNICVYHGHPSLGYKVLSSGVTVFIHPSSSVCFFNTYPNYIMYADVPDKKTKQVKVVFALNDALAMSLLEFNKDATDAVNDNVVKPCKFDGVGESIAIELEKVWNSNSTSGENFKDALELQCNNTPLLFERNSTANGMTIYALPEYHKAVRIVADEAIQRIRDRLKVECLEIGFPDEKSHLRLLMGPGGTNERFLFSHDFRSVWIHETQPGALTKDFVLTEMKKYGPVVDVLVSDKAAREESGIWGTVTFQNPDDVIKVLSSSKSHSGAMLIELAPNTCNNFQPVQPKVRIDKTVTVKVKLCRRPARSGLATVKLHEKHELGVLLKTRMMTIKKSKVSTSVGSGDGNVAQLSGLRPTIQDQDISTAIFEKLGIMPSEITVKRVAPFLSSADDLHKFKTSLQRLVDKAVDMSKVNIRVFLPRSDDLYIGAELKFPTRRVAVSAMDYVSGAKIAGLPLEIVSNPLEDPSWIPAATIKIKDDVYQTVKHQIKKQVARLSDDVGVRLFSDVKDGDGSHHVLKIYSHNIVEAEVLTSRLEELLSPLQIKVSRKRCELLVKEGESLLDTVMDDTKTFIDLCRETGIISIYGTKSHVLKAKQAVLEGVDQLMEAMAQSNDNTTYKLLLQGSGKPPTLLIEVMKDLDGLANRSGAKNLKIDVKRKTLCYTGTDDAHFAMQAMIDSLCDLIRCSSVAMEAEPTIAAEEESETIDCSACYCPVESPDFSLQTCLHHYCKECINTHVKVSLENKGFPITCVDESCGQPISVRDIMLLAGRQDRGMWKVLKASVDQYVQTRPKEFGFCFKPDCQGVVHKKPHAISYSCSLCNTSVCPRCLNNRRRNHPRRACVV